MKKNRFAFIWVIYFFVFELLVFYPSYSSKVMFALFLFNIVLTLINKKNGMIALFSSFIMSNEMIAIMNFLCILLLTTKLDKNKTKIINRGLLFFIILGNSIISAAISSTYINVIFSACYLLLIAFFISRLELYELDDNELKRNIKGIIVLEFIVFISLLLKYKMLVPSDINYGTLMNAHSFGYLLIVVIIYLIGNNNHIYNIKKNWIYILLCVIMIYFTDAKALIFSLILLAIILPFINRKERNSNKKTVFSFIIIIYLALYIAIPIIKTSNVQHFIKNNTEGVYQYIYDNKYNYKFNYFDGTLYKELKGYRFLFGFGLGQYGSRFSNLFTYDISYRNENFLNTFVKNNFKPHYNHNYIKYISFYSTDFVKGMQWRSAILTYPYNSIIAIIGEIGWVGLIILALFIDSSYKKSKYKVILYFFIITCLFDNYFDMFQTIGLVLFFLSIKYNNFENNNKIT